MAQKRNLRSIITDSGLRVKIIATAILLILVWLCFFDSHSILRRVRWQREYNAYRAENEQLSRQIEELTRKLEDGVSDEEIEEIAREQFGMRRPGDTVYRLEHSE